MRRSDDDARLRRDPKLCLELYKIQRDDAKQHQIKMMILAYCIRWADNAEVIQKLNDMNLLIIASLTGIRHPVEHHQRLGVFMLLPPEVRRNAIRWWRKGERGVDPSDEIQTAMLPQPEPEGDPTRTGPR